MPVKPPCGQGFPPLICEHSLNLSDVQWGHDSVAWNNLAFKALKMGYAAEINEVEKNEVLNLLQILNPLESNYNILKPEFETIVLIDEFFFKILAVLHDKYKDENMCLDLMCGEKQSIPPKWDNFNKYQAQKHLQQLEPKVGNYFSPLHQESI